MTSKIAARLLAISAMCILAMRSGSLAEEGFSSDKHALAVAIQAVWESVFSITALPGQKGGTGSGVLVSSGLSSSGGRILHILTAEHVVSSKCGPRLGWCKNILLGSGRSPVSSGNGATEDSPMRTVSGAEVVARLEPLDLALLKVEVDTSEDWALQPVPVAKQCDQNQGRPVFLIGYPNTAARAAGGMEAIGDQGVMKRRWSRGVTLDPVASQGDWIGITADALQGSSGAPAFSADGDLVGIVHRVSGNRYVGNEAQDQAHRAWQSLLVPCDSVRTFLEEALR